MNDHPFEFRNLKNDYVIDQYNQKVEMLPFFVYGTLRPGHGNHAWALAPRQTRSLLGTISGARMYSNGGFPFVAFDGDDTETVTGNLIWVPRDQFAATLSDLDSLEGYQGGDKGLYDRRVVEVAAVNGETIRANMYVVPAHAHSHVVARCPHVPSGDWEDVRQPFRPGLGF